MGANSNSEVLNRIQSALEAARQILGRFTAGAIEAEYEAGHDPVTEADKCVDAVLRKELLREGEGWLSEESVDDLARLNANRVWIVDPLDGTREFVAGIPEFCVSVAMVAAGRPIAGGICNPATNEILLGSIDSGVSYQGNAGGFVRTLESSLLRCNNKSPLISGLLGCGPNLEKELLALLGDHLPAAARR